MDFNNIAPTDLPSIQEDILLLYWRSRGMPFEDITRVIDRHFEKWYPWWQLGTRLQSILGREQRFGGLDLVLAPNRWLIPNIDRWIRSKQAQYHISDAQIDRLTSLYSHGIKDELWRVSTHWLLATSADTDKCSTGWS